MHKSSGAGSNTSIFKGTLKNILQKLSDDAEQQISSRNEKVNCTDNISRFDLEKRQTQDDCPYDNFTQDFYLERYKNYMPSKFVTPAEFKCYGLEKTTEADLGNSDRSLDVYQLVQKAKAKFDFGRTVEGFNLINWARGFKEVNGVHKDLPPNTVLFKFFMESGFESKNWLIMAQVESVKEIDEIVIFSLKDFSRKEREVIIKDIQGFSCEFSKGSVIIFKCSDLNVYSKMSHLTWVNFDKIKIIK